MIAIGILLCNVSLDTYGLIIGVCEILVKRNFFSWARPQDNEW